MILGEPSLGKIQIVSYNAKMTYLLKKYKKKIQNEATDFYFVLFSLKLLIGATNREGPEKYSSIPLGILGPSKFTESV